MTIRKASQNSIWNSPEPQWLTLYIGPHLWMLSDPQSVGLLLIRLLQQIPYSFIIDFQETRDIWNKAQNQILENDDIFSKLHFKEGNIVRFGRKWAKH